MTYPNLEAELSRAGVMRLQLAQELGLTRATISSKIRGRYGGFTISQATAIRDTFFPEMSIDYLFAEEPMPATKPMA